MPIRTLQHHGTEWTIWNVTPSLDHRLRIPLTGSTGAGWLCFQSDAEKRRIVPVPEGWEDWPEEALAAALETAQIVGTSPPLNSQENQARGDRLRDQLGESVRQVEDLGARVRRATNDPELPAEPAEEDEPASESSMGWRERGPDEDEESREGES
jgi:hypothetical protein